MKEQLITGIKSGFPLIGIQSAEVFRGVDETKAIVDEFNKELKDRKTSDFLKQHGYQVKTWDGIGGFQDQAGNFAKDTADSIRCLDYIKRDDVQACIYILQNFHFYWDDIMLKPQICQLFSDLAKLRIPHKHVIVIGPYGGMPIEIAHLFMTVDFQLPSKAELIQLSHKFDTILKKNKLTEDQRKVLADAAAGMTLFEAENSMRMSLISSEGKGIDPLVVQEAKAAAVKKSGLLEYEKSPFTLDLVGGMVNIKEWLLDLAYIYHNKDKAEAYGLGMPKGVLITGISGTGKSLIAKCLANLFGVPFFRGDIGKLFGSLVGETEQKTEAFFKLIDSVAPAVILLDEIEKMLAGLESSGQSDAGVTSRLIGRLLTYMQDKKNSSFFVATANDVTKLRSELLRKGRFNQIFFIDLPTSEEREAILKIHLNLVKRDPANFDVAEIVKATKNCIGAEIEGFITDAMYKAFAKGEEVETRHILEAVAVTPLLSSTKEQEITELRRWAKGRARLANLKIIEPVTGDGLGEFDTSGLITGEEKEG